MEGQVKLSVASYLARRMTRGGGFEGFECQVGRAIMKALTKAEMKTMPQSGVMVLPLVQYMHDRTTVLLSVKGGAMMAFKFLVLASAVVFLPVSSFADTHTAASCSLPDVTAAYNAASAGDTVVIPPGNSTWTSGLTITKQIVIQGAGKNLTRIEHNGTATLMTISLVADVPVRITGIHFRFSTNNPGGRAIQIDGRRDGSFAITKIRIDNCRFEKGTRTVHVVGWTEGVIDNNEFLNCNIAVGLTGDDDNSWTRPIQAGTSRSMFIEDNGFTIDNAADREPNEQIYHQQGARSVVRYNTFDGTAYTNGNSWVFDTHGNWGSPITQYRGQPILEVYNNTVNVYKTSRYMYIRGGSVIVHSNVFAAAVGSPVVFVLTEEEGWTSGGPWCPACPVDTQWPAQDQIFNSFFWNNTSNGAAVTTVYLSGGNATEFIQEDRDYFMHAPQSTGGRSTFVGAAGGSMTFSSAGANAYYPYIPYTYPHPLREEVAVAAPQGLRVLVD